MNLGRHDVGHLPNLLVIRAAKCATTSLHFFLRLHPEVSMTREKERHFFVRDVSCGKGIDWFRSHFRGEAKIHGESLLSYTGCPRYRRAPERTHSIVPQAKLIYVVWDPMGGIARLPERRRGPHETVYRTPL